MMKTIHTGWSQTARRHTLYLFAIFTLLGTFLLPSCRDEDLLPSTAGTRAEGIRSDATLNNGGAGLVRNADGYWVATRRVPLVGAGRVVNNVSNALVEVGSIDDDQIEEYASAAQNVVDTDLMGTTFKPTAIVGAQIAFNQIISVLDLNRVYAGGQKAGFALKADTEGILSVGLFNGLVLRAYRDGESVGEVKITDKTSLLDISVGNIVSGDATSVYVIEGTFSEPFDELQLGTGGISVNLANNDVEILYAYVGENPMIPAVNQGSALSQAYFGADNITTPTGQIPGGNGSLWATYDYDASLYKLINPLEGYKNLAEEDGVYLVTIINSCCMTVDFGRTIPAGSEVGFIGTGFSILSGLVNSASVTTYDGDEQAESYSISEILNVNLFGAEDASVFSLVTKKECTRVRFWRAGLLDVPGLSNTVIHYAYVREPVEVDASSYFSFTDATVYTPNYRFADPVLDGARVEYSIRSQVGEAEIISIEGEDGDKKNLLSNMNVAGSYEIEAKYYAPDSKEPVIYTAVITRRAKEEDYCNTPLTNDDGKHWVAEIIDEQYGLNIFGDQYEGSLDNVVNENKDDYIETKTGLLSLLADKGIIRVKSVDGTSVNKEGKNIRAGFIINRSTSLLSLDALKFLRIELWNDGQKVDGGLGDDNSGVSLGLIGNVSSGDGSGLARLSFDTNVEFDCIELHSSGLLDLNLSSSIKIYYAFWDEASQECANPGEECMELITNANYGAMATTNSLGLASVGATIVDLGSIVDNSIESKATITNPVVAGNSTEIEVTFDEIQGNQEVGFILSDIKGLLDVSLIGIIDIKAFDRNGVEIGDGETVGTGLGLKLIGGGDRYYISVAPSRPFCKLRLTFGKGVGALESVNIHGVFLRPDYDGDGVMDCIKDGLLADINELEISDAHICQGDGVPEFIVTSGGVEEKFYTLIFRDYAHPETTPVEKTTQAQVKNGKLVFESGFLEGLAPGYYGITVEQDNDLNNICFLSVHPKCTTWKGNSTDWNDWSNWDNGVPFDCTDVILPADRDNYPDLINPSRTTVYDAPYYCQNIYFAPGAELVGQHKLSYSGKVFIDMDLKSGYYHLLSAPLQEMITGDMFVAKNADEWEQNRSGNYFKSIDENAGYTEQRTSPYVYQRFWSSKVENTVLSRSSSRDDYNNTEDEAIECDLLTTDWSRTFNSVEAGYAKGQGFALRVGEDAWGQGSTGRVYAFHFPKSFTSYNYYSYGGASPIKTVENIARKDDATGHFWIDACQNNLTHAIPLSRESEGNLFLFGNPVMSHINIAGFLRVNPDVTAVLVYNEQDKEYEAIDNEGASTGEITQIAPMQAVFLQTSTDATSLNVRLEEGMLEEKNRSVSVYAAPRQLRLSANSGNRSASCLIINSSSASDDYDAEEDVCLLVGGEEGSGLAVYTVADRKALSIQRVNGAARIPVGFCMKRTGDVDLKFEAGNEWSSWQLTDTQTGQSYPLEGTVSLDNVADGTGRFYLEKR